MQAFKNNDKHAVNPPVTEGYITYLLQKFIIIGDLVI